MNRHVILVLTCLLGACSSGLDVHDEEQLDDGPPAESKPETVEIQMFYSWITVEGDCDADLAFGIDNPGEIAFKVGYSIQRDDESWPQMYAARQSLDYGSRNGEQRQTKSGEKFSLEGLESTITVKKGLGYRLHFHAIEWDGGRRDDRMDDRGAYHEQVAGTDGLWESVLTVGASPVCRFSLDISGWEHENI